MRQNYKRHVKFIFSYVKCEKKEPQVQECCDFFTHHTYITYSVTVPEIHFCHVTFMGNNKKFIYLSLYGITENQKK